MKEGNEGKNKIKARCSGLFTRKRSSSAPSTWQGFKEGGLRCSELGTGGGGHVSHSDAQVRKVY
ncbi:hypothetical protein PIB30_063407 [Stylosanthes scabra]|uniref:Uncharacterized protein n=1 Tax=Stylosanthes scabra TaxID=79078 RepID=A0ABU6RLJ2_9FABA|nr:hypothetical protein [Stylosanthes scabra]